VCSLVGQQLADFLPDYREGKMISETIPYLMISEKMRRTAWNPALESLMLGLAVLWICSGCSHLERITQPKAQDSAVEDLAAKEHKSFDHRVKWPGESLSIIAKWYTGDSTNWKALAKANPDLNPNLIRIGDRILIPESLIENEEPMPRDFLPSSTRKTGKAKVSAITETAPEEQKLEREQLELLDEVWDVSLDPKSEEHSQ
jgi:hypothetical protein